jgi:hypothetical protein
LDIGNQVRGVEIGLVYLKKANQIFNKFSNQIKIIPILVIEKASWPLGLIGSKYLLYRPKPKRFHGGRRTKIDLQKWLDGVLVGG